MKKRSLVALIVIACVALSAIALKNLYFQRISYSCAYMPWGKISGTKVVYIQRLYLLNGDCVPERSCASSQENRRSIKPPFALTDEGIKETLLEFFAARNEYLKKKLGNTFKGCPLPQIRTINNAAEFRDSSAAVRGGDRDAVVLKIQIQRFLKDNQPLFLMSIDVEESEPYSWPHWRTPWLIADTITPKDLADSIFRSTVMPNGTIMP